MKKYFVFLGAVLFAALLFGAFVVTDANAKGRKDAGVIYVRSQGLYYDTFGTADPLPPHGNFQELYMGDHGVETEYGPGDREYKGGRWKEDFDGDGVYHYFNCPLLGPGREEP